VIAVGHVISLAWCERQRPVALPDQTLKHTKSTSQHCVAADCLRSKKQCLALSGVYHFGLHNLAGGGNYQ
jgi:hypothetical protein